MRVAFVDDETEEQWHEEAHGRLVETQLPCEWHAAGYVAILLHSAEDQAKVLDAFSAEIEADQIEWEVDPEPFDLDPP